MDKRDWVIIWLSIQISAISYLWFKAEKKVSFFQGQQQAYQDLSTENDGTSLLPLTRR